MKSSRQQLSKSWSTDLLPPDGPAGYRKTVVRGVGELRLPPVREIEGGAHPGVAQGSGQSPVKERRGGAEVGDVVVRVEPHVSVEEWRALALAAPPLITETAVDSATSRVPQHRDVSPGLHPDTGDGQGEVLVPAGPRRAAVQPVLGHLQTVVWRALRTGHGGDDVRVDVTIGQAGGGGAGLGVGGAVDDDTSILGLQGGLRAVRCRAVAELHGTCLAGHLLLPRQAARPHLQDQHGDDDDDDHEDQDHGDADPHNLPRVEGGGTREISHIECEVCLHLAGLVLCQAPVLAALQLCNRSR